MGFFLVLKAELVRNLIIARRYWFATLIGLILGYGMLMVAIITFMYDPSKVSGMIPGGDKVVNTALGLIIGMFAFGIVGMFSQGLQTMATTGELEQVCMNPHGLITNFMARSMVSAVSSIVSCIVMLTLISLTTGGSLHANSIRDWGPLSILLVLTYSNLIGFGFMVGGLVLVFKQVGQIVTIFRLGMLLLAAAVDQEFFNKLGTYKFGTMLQAAIHTLPITDAAICLKLVLIKGSEWRIVVNSHFYFLIVSCVAWTLIGVACFRYMENWSRNKGTLGAY